VCSLSLPSPHNARAFGKTHHGFGKNFGLWNALDAAQPIAEFGGGEKLYAATNISQIDVDKLVYFPASVFWKGSVHAWKSGGKSLNLLSLGQKYNEEFR
jgi:hypothetical protein